MTEADRGELIPREPSTVRRRLAPREMRVVREPQRHSLDGAFVVVGVTVHNAADSIRRCLASVLQQKTGPFPIATLILDDSSTDGWEEKCQDLIEALDACVVRAHCGSPSHARNAVLDFVQRSCPHVDWVARLDADDRLSTPDSLGIMCEATDPEARFVLGGNRLVCRGQLLGKANPASAGLLNLRTVLRQLAAMADGTVANELPSCNLLISPKAGWRYPTMDSAEDHWLVTQLLLLHAARGRVATEGFYSDYTLNGAATQANIAAGAAKESREKLSQAAQIWVETQRLRTSLLGYGMEGVVVSDDSIVEKRFYPWALDGDQVEWLKSMPVSPSGYLPAASWHREGECWVAAYPLEVTSPVVAIAEAEATDFLAFCLDAGLVCLNIKRSNFRRRGDGSLLYVDVGSSVVPMDVDYFRDSAARTYAISVLGWQDDELRRRPTERRQTDILGRIPGFEEFYSELLEARTSALWNSVPGTVLQAPVHQADDVTLMIKVCPMDAALAEQQIRHIVCQTKSPARFRETVVLVDPFEGPYVRPYAKGDAQLLGDVLQRLVGDGTVDRLLVFPNTPEATRQVNVDWFGINCIGTHSGSGVPVSAQLWGFDQIRTRFLLQCDVDVLVGRLDLRHDFLEDMQEAARPDDILGVAFNIPHRPSSSPTVYDAGPGRYVPEVRCGLLELHRLRSHRPYPNSVEEGRLALTWYRSVEKYQKLHGLRTLRGGDPRTFYIHPMARHKGDGSPFARIRDLVTQGRLPEAQYDQWDLQGTADDWHYPQRHEDVVFLVRGRSTPRAKVERCVASLAAQDDQSFGVIVIDDATGPEQAAFLRQTLRPIWDRTTLVCNEDRRGPIPNTITAVGEICGKPSAMVTILDLDDALMDRSVVRTLRDHRSAGHDVVLGAMCRPDKPTKVYHPNFHDPRASFGGEVWIHLRAFRKSLFDALSHDDLMLDGEWIPECEDYAIMVPVVEMAKKPVYIPRYLYYHDRSTPRTPETRARKDRLIRAILGKGSRENR